MENSKQIRHLASGHTHTHLFRGIRWTHICQKPKARCNRRRSYCGWGLEEPLEKIALDLGPGYLYKQTRVWEGANDLFLSPQFLHLYSRYNPNSHRYLSQRKGVKIVKSLARWLAETMRLMTGSYRNEQCGRGPTLPCSWVCWWVTPFPRFCPWTYLLTVGSRWGSLVILSFWDSDFCEHSLSTCWPRHGVKGARRELCKTGKTRSQGAHSLEVQVLVAWWDFQRSHFIPSFTNP